MRLPFPHSLSLLLLLILFSLSQAARTENVFPDQEAPAPSSVTPGKAWREETTALPSWPRDADLIEFQPDGPRGALRYFIDRASLRVGMDQVVRYTLVAETPGGARNVAHEGLRCTPKGSYRPYAYGLDGRFERLPETDTPWRPLPDQAGEAWRRTLWSVHFCVPRSFAPRPIGDIVRSLRGRTPPPRDAELLSD